MTEESPAPQDSYEIVHIKRADPPSGAKGTNWYRYLIAFGGTNSIRGVRQGSLNVVTAAVEEIVAQMNDRHRGKRGRVHLVPAPKKKTAAKGAKSK